VESFELVVSEGPASGESVADHVRRRGDVVVLWRDDPMLVLAGHSVHAELARLAAVSRQSEVRLCLRGSTRGASHGRVEWANEEAGVLTGGFRPRE
jgi:hypothetical protein